MLKAVYIGAALFVGSSHMAIAAEEDFTPPADIAARVAEATAAAEAGGSGPMPAEMVSDPGLPTHTVYRPRDLEAAMEQGRLPIIAWGNGACANIGNRFRYFLTEVASEGYLVVATGPAGPQYVEWKVDLGADPNLPPGGRSPQSYAAQMNDAIGWAIAENDREGSPYYHRLDTQAVAVMGQSCGGLQAISAAADPRVKTALVLNSGTFAEGSPPFGGTGDATKASLDRLHTPVAWISGDASDVAHGNAAGDFAAVHGVPAMWAYHDGTGHSEHYREPGGGLFVAPVVSWLDWHLKGRKTAATMFSGEDCRLCSEPGWHVRTKDM